ncbi:hypothetical protein DDE82_007850 [Stemphylium lycopersici]|nr:hypothetical protein DDE82_007850 [Stemphylium lycopersici]
MDSDENETVYKPRPQLPQPNVHMRSLASLIKELENGTIEVDPEYQREVVWTADRMTGLINSLMENYYIPPIILNKKKGAVGDDGQTRDMYLCVDGKQRLSSVRAFVKGMIPCHDHRGEKWWFCEPDGLRRKNVLSEDIQTMFLEKDFVAFQFAGLSQFQEKDLFARVQMGVQLSAAEKMRAKSGPWQELASLFVADFPMIYMLMKDRSRGKDFQLTLSCFSQIIEARNPTAANGLPALKTSYSVLEKLLNNTGAVDDAIKSHLASTWTVFRELVEMDSNVFTNANRYLRGVQTFAPVEVVGVTVLISKYFESRNGELLLGDIKALREALREEFTELRTNASVWTFTWRWIDNLEAFRGPVDGSTVRRNLTGQAPIPAASSSAAMLLELAVSAPHPARSSPLHFKKRTNSKNRPRTTLSVETADDIETEISPRVPAPKRRRTGSGPSASTANVRTPEVRERPRATPREYKTAGDPAAAPPASSDVVQQPSLQQFSSVSWTPASPQLSSVAKFEQDNAERNIRPERPPKSTVSMPTAAAIQDFQRLEGAIDRYVAPNNSLAIRKSDRYIPEECHKRYASGSDGHSLGRGGIDSYRPRDDASSRRRDQDNSNCTSHIPELTPHPTSPVVREAPVTQPSRNCPSPSTFRAPEALFTTVSSTLAGWSRDSLEESATEAQRGRGLFGFRPTQEQMDGIVTPVSPPRTTQAPPHVPIIEHGASTVSSSQPRPNRQQGNAAPRPSITQIDGIIDLTGDD